MSGEVANENNFEQKEAPKWLLDWTEQGSVDKIKDTNENDPKKIDEVIISNTSFALALLNNLSDKNQLNWEQLNQLFGYMNSNPNDEAFFNEIDEKWALLIKNLEIFIAANNANITREQLEGTSAIINHLDSIKSPNWTNTFELTKIKKEIKTHQINFLKEDLKQERFYKEVVNQYIDKIYAKQLWDTKFIEYMKANVNITKNKENIAEYFEKWLDPDSKTKFNITKINSFFNGDYSVINTNVLKIEWLETIENDYKKTEIKKDISNIIQQELWKYSFSEQDKNDIYNRIKWDYDEKINKFNYEEIKSNYKKIGKDSPFKKEISSELVDVVAEYNKEYLMQEFKKIPEINTNSNNIKHFETMLDETTNKNINTLAIGVNYPGQNPKILQDLWKKIETRWDKKNSIKFTNAKIVNTKIEEIDSKSIYTTTLKEEASEEILSEDMGKGIQEHINSLLSNTNVSEIKVSIPTWNINIQSQIYDIIWSMNIDDKSRINIIEAENISKVKIESNEIKEVPGKIHLDLKRLPYNVIWDQEKIWKVLSEADPKMKEIIEDPNFMITGWNIYGSASFQRTGYNGVWKFQKYKWIANVENKLDNGNGATQVDWWSGWVTNNPTLAYDRATSFLDFFYTKGNKISDDPKFNIKYGVNGKSKAELVKELNITNENDPVQKSRLEEWFKEWQYAILDLDFIKTEKTSTVKEFDIDKKDGFVASLSVSIVWQQNNTWWDTPRHTPVRLRKMFDGSWWGHIPSRFKPIPCAAFD